MASIQLTTLRAVANAEDFWEKPAFITALVNCLNPSQACAALEVRTRTSPVLRRALLRRIQQDCRTGGFRRCHHGLVGKLLADYATLPADRKPGCGVCLSALLEVGPLSTRSMILQFCLSSKHVAMRRRGYKALRANWDKRFSEITLRTWSTHGDPECALLVVERFPVECLVDNLGLLEEALPRHWGLARLYLRLGAARPLLLPRLAAIDAITYAYVLAKLGRRIPAKDAIALVERNCADPRVGLLIWSLGKMKQFGALAALVDRAPALREKQVAALLGRK